MAGYVLLAVLAGLGARRLGWALFGGVLPVSRKGWLLYPGRAGQLEFVPLYLWLRGAGLVKSPLLVADLGLSCEERAYLADRDVPCLGQEALRRQLEELWAEK